MICVMNRFKETIYAWLELHMKYELLVQLMDKNRGIILVSLYVSKKFLKIS
jgi:hypothetical protein